MNEPGRRLPSSRVATRATKRDKPADVTRSPKTTAKSQAGRKSKAPAPTPAQDGSEAHDEESPERPTPNTNAGSNAKAEDDDDEKADRDSEPAGVDAEMAELEAAPIVDDEADDPFTEKDADEGHEGTRSAPLSRAAAGTSMERLDPMAAYLREVQRHPLLTPEQTHELASRFVETQDPAIAAQLVTANLRLVVKIAYEYRRAYKNIMDLVQEGNIGLMQAVKRYDPYRGVKLSSYAAWWIRAYILRFILNNWRLVKLGTTQAQRKLFFNLRKKRAELQAMGIDPTNAEIAKQLNVPESDVAEMDVRLAQSEKSLDAPVGDADGRAIAKVDMMPAAGAGPETQMADEELQALLKDKLAEFRKTLAGKEKDVAIFDMRLVADDPLTLQDLGDKFGISRERVRQLEQRLLGRLREYLKREMGDATESL
jgi:RNA polymerase sigma-32 factor